MTRAVTLFLASVCILSVGTAARADALPVYSWGYQFEAGPNPVHTFIQPNSYATVIVPGTGQNMNMASDAGVNTRIDTPVATSSNATVSDPIDVKHIPFTEKLQITDSASGQTGAVTFRGYLSGDVWNTGSTLHPTFIGPMIQTVDINHHIYTVQFTSYNSPGGNGQFGSFNFNVSVAHNPEPSTLVLAGIGLPMLGLTVRRRKKQAQKA